MSATLRSARTQPDPEWVHRFGLAERVGHWWTVAMLGVAALSGLAMGDDDPSGPFLVVHVGAVVALVAGAAVIAAATGWRRLMSLARELFLLDATDRAWLAGTARHPFDRPAQPQWGMFNAGQKAMAWMLAASVTGLISTGLLALFAHTAGGLHALFAVSTAMLVGAHVFMAVVNPSTRHALHGMVFGRVRRAWAAQHHPRWLH